MPASSAVTTRAPDSAKRGRGLPLPKGPINYLNYNPFALQVSENVDRFAYNITGGSLVPGNPSKTKLNEPFDSAAAEYIVGPGDQVNWVTEPKIASPNPAVGTISQQYLFTPVGGIGGSFDAGAGVLTLAGPGTEAEFTAALRNVRYWNPSDDPTTGTRRFTFRLTNTAGASPPAVSS